MLLAALLLVAGAVSAPGDIYRCVGADGRARFQDVPCAGAAGKSAQKFEGGESPADLRKWLQELKKRGGRAGPQPPVAADSGARPVAAPAALGPVNERLLARCSQRFLDCANGNAAAMDECISKTPRCAPGGGSSACCPSACVSRYQGLRSLGAPMATAVRDALLDPNAPSCTL
jgi:hypothetical protein